MAPERLAPDAGRNLTPAADIFAWGAVVAYAATGRNPFAADSPAAIAGRILTQPPQLDGVPPGLAGIVGRALAKDPAQRPTAQELLVELVSGTAPVEVRGGHRRWRVVAAAAAVVLLSVASAWAGARFGGDGRDQPAAVAPRPSSSSAAPDPASARQSTKELFDPLTSPSLWAPSGPAEEGCDFDSGLVVRTEYSATVSVDGRTMLTSDLSRGKPTGARHTKGKVTFGASGGGGPAIKVTLRDAHIEVP